MEGDEWRKETFGNPLGETRRHSVRKLPALNANVALETDRRAGARTHMGHGCACATVSLSVLSTVSGY